MAKNELIIPEVMNAVQIFVEGNNAELLSYIKTESKITDPTTKTKKGRDLIRSTAAKIASSKVFIEKIGKDLADGERKKIDDTLSAIQKNRNFIKDCLVYHQADVRKLLTDYEAEQKAIEEAQKLEIEKQAQHVEALEHNQFLIDRKKLDDEKQQLEKERLQREAEENARVKIENEQKETREEETRKRIQAEENAKRLEQKAIDDAKQAEIDKHYAVTLAEQRAEDEAKRVETARIEAERLAARIAESKAADTANQQKVNNEALNSMINFGMQEDYAKQIIVAIIQGKFEHVTINY